MPPYALVTPPTHDPHRVSVQSVTQEKEEEWTTHSPTEPGYVAAAASSI